MKYATSMTSVQLVIKTEDVLCNSYLIRLRLALM